MKGFFITGTDTEVGKTAITLGMIQAFQNAGVKVGGMKPIAAGAIQTDVGLRNDDAVQIMSQVGGGDDVFDAYQVVNPYVFEQPIAPHIAARKTDTVIELPVIQAAFDVLSTDHDIIVIEGAGGWKVPLSDDLDMEALAKNLGFPVVLVVGIRLGCLNHALLTADAIVTAGLSLKGWVANQIDPVMVSQSDNINTLKQRIDAPFLGSVPYLPDVSAQTVAEYLDVVSFI